ncbi:hypothetical protein HanXRQr2_Chr11g0478081 [Helianthus annuus]|uniref:Uncharacterized protein n=1 Tax=Helianthus annuus TaxID=4232 RepID=A0A251TA41_HELAN|nr:hypothetical protein HanXRQr2_Chr11g0478081 [Helianthus annuus]
MFSKRIYQALCYIIAFCCHRQIARLKRRLAPLKSITSCIIMLKKDGKMMRQKLNMQLLFNIKRRQWQS